MSDNPASAYDMSHVEESEERRTLAVIVDNEPGVLGRVVGLFSARGYNIESLTVAEVDRTRHRSRITIVTTGTAHTLEQIEAQLLRLVPVASVTDITKSKRGLERELALIKVAGEYYTSETRFLFLSTCILCLWFSLPVICLSTQIYLCIFLSNAFRNTNGWFYQSQPCLQHQSDV